MLSPLLTWNEALSGIFGSISLASWVFLLVPQLLENYRAGSAEGISLTFIVIWAVGDVLNLAGALWAGLVPTVVALGFYFTVADTVLILQCLYYKRVNEKKEKTEYALAFPAGDGVAAGEETPLLNGAPTSPTTTAKRRITDVTDDNMGLPGSRRRSSAASHQRLTNEPARTDSLSRILEEPIKTSAWLKNTVSVFLILCAGIAGWAIAWKAGAWRPTPVGEAGEAEDTPIGAEILGYASAVLYLGARIPQIVKNQRERSCDGLSLLFFLLSVMGNATYGAGILFHSVERQYFLTNLPWLIGSLGTMAEDAFIFIQFSMFGEKAVPEDAVI